jgi:hypothetical protein
MAAVTKNRTYGKIAGNNSKKPSDGNSSLDPSGQVS